MSILDRILGRKKKEEETPKPQQVAEDVAKARREQLAREKAEAEAARLRAEQAEKERLAALAKAKEQATQATGAIPGAYTGAIPGVPTTGPSGTQPVTSYTGAIPGTAPAQPKAEPRYYVVKDGDYLSKIAKEIYGDAKRWPEIYEANKALIGDNPNIIHAGQKLLIP